jgi:hypothetical protein
VTDSEPVEDAPCCFVIAPIGGEGTEVRKRSDQILEHIIRPVVSECGYSGTAGRPDGATRDDHLTSD